MFLCALVLALILCAIPGQAQAASSGTCGDDLTWQLDDEGTLTISCTGAMDDFLDDTEGPWGTYGIENLVIQQGVTTIGQCAFRGCTSLTSVTIPDSVTTIGMYAFQGCTA